MRLTDLYRLEIGTRVRLKGTNATFSVRKVDYTDDERPVFLRLINSDKPVLTKLYAGGEHTIIYPSKNGEEAWIFNNKTLMREDVGYSRSEFEKACEGYHVANVRDLEVVKVSKTMDDLDKHIDPRDLIYRGQPDDQTAQKQVEPLPVTKACELSNANDPAMIELINHAIEYEANLGLRVVMFSELPPIPEAIKEKYRLVGYTVTEHAIEW